MTTLPAPHSGKSLTINVDGRPFARYPVRTPVVTAQDDLAEIIRAHVAMDLRLRDILFISERMVAITQGRAYRTADIRPSRWATVLNRFVTRSPYGLTWLMASAFAGARGVDLR